MNEELALRAVRLIVLAVTSTFEDNDDFTRVCTDR